jgi:hypothetical protein
MQDSLPILDGASDTANGQAVIIQASDNSSVMDGSYKAAGTAEDGDGTRSTIEPTQVAMMATPPDSTPSNDETLVHPTATHGVARTSDPDSPVTLPPVHNPTVAAASESAEQGSTGDNGDEETDAESEEDNGTEETDAESHAEEPASDQSEVATKVSKSMLLNMLHELKNEFETYRATTQQQLEEQQQKLEDQRIQLLNAQRVQGQECDSLAEDLSTKCAKQDSEIKLLNKRCQALETALNKLKKDRQTCAAHPDGDVLTQSSGTPAESTETIAVITNHGRYSSAADHSAPESLSLSLTTPSSPSHTFAPPAAHSEQQAEFVRSDSRQSQSQSDNSVNGPHVHYGPKNSDRAPRVPPIKLPAVATKLIIGDFNLKHINMKRLNAEREIQVLTMSGARINTVRQAFAATDRTRSIKKVVVHVGANNIAGRHSDAIEQCIEEYKVLLDTVRDKMPDAKIAVSSIPPLKPWGKSKAAHALNMELMDLCRAKKAIFLPHDELWLLDEDGLLNLRILRDRVHLSPVGLGLFLRDTKEFLTGTRPRRNSAAHQPSHASNEVVSSKSYASTVVERQTAGRESDKNVTPKQHKARRDGESRGQEESVGRSEPPSHAEGDRRVSSNGESRNQRAGDHERTVARDTEYQSRGGAQSAEGSDDRRSPVQRRVHHDHAPPCRNEHPVYHEYPPLPPRAGYWHPGDDDYYAHDTSHFAPYYSSAMSPPPPPPPRDFYPARGYYDHHPLAYYRGW